MKALEDARNTKKIGKPGGATDHYRGGSGVFGAGAHRAELRYLFIVSAVRSAGLGQRQRRRDVEVKKADGSKCDRCWNYSTHVGEDKTYPTVCERCSAVLKELEGCALILFADSAIASSRTRDKLLSQSTQRTAAKGAKKDFRLTL